MRTKHSHRKSLFYFISTIRKKFTGERQTWGGRQMRGGRGRETTLFCYSASANKTEGQTYFVIQLCKQFQYCDTIKYMYNNSMTAYSVTHAGRFLVHLARKEICTPDTTNRRLKLYSKNEVSIFWNTRNSFILRLMHEPVTWEEASNWNHATCSLDIRRNALRHSRYRTSSYHYVTINSVLLYIDAKYHESL